MLMLSILAEKDFKLDRMNRIFRIKVFKNLRPSTLFILSILLILSDKDFGARQDKQDVPAPKGPGRNHSSDMAFLISSMKFFAALIASPASSGETSTSSL